MRGYELKAKSIDRLELTKRNSAGPLITCNSQMIYHRSPIFTAMCVQIAALTNLFMKAAVLNALIVLGVRAVNHE